jgi:hypothetical protein
MLVVAGCPHTVAATLVLEAAARQAGVSDIPVTVTVVTSDQQAREREFGGSPTILIDGKDPFGVPGAPVGLTCRMYPSRSGLSGVPDLDDLRDALLKAGSGRATAAGDR